MENKFKQRSIKPELLDEKGLTQADLFQNLRELEVINRLLGGHRATLKGIKKVLGKKTKLRIIDFACGGGDTLRRIADWGEQKGIEMELKGVDILEDAIQYAQKESKSYSIEWEVNHFKMVKDEKHDLAICSLTCHHFYADELTAFINKMNQTAEHAVIINDLHRHPIAYYGISILSRLFSKSHLVKHDSKLSVLKGFKRKEWDQLLKSMGYKKYQIQWIWAFRHLIILKK